VAAGVLATAPAEAQVAGKLEVGISGMLGVGDKGKVDGSAGGVQVSQEDDLDPSGGFGIHALYTVLPFLDGGGLDLGGRVAFLWWQAEDAVAPGVPIADHGTLIDISLMAKPRMRFLDERLEVYLKVPLGLTISVLEDLPNVTKGRTGAGVNFGLLPGVSWTFVQHWVLFLDLGYALHWMRHEGESKANPLFTVSGTQEYTAHEFAMNLGLAYRF
jgi:hypothetical protein